jgi:hypothetical protein
VALKKKRQRAIRGRDCMAPVTLRRGNLRNGGNKKHTTCCCWFSAAGGGGAPQERGVAGVAAGTNTHHALAFLTLLELFHLDSVLPICFNANRILIELR